jgi:HTH-type transcriptional regulator/antitoxin HigA
MEEVGGKVAMGKVPEKYLDLIRSFPLRPIRTDGELRQAEKVLHALVDAVALSAPERDYLEVLGNLIEEYEEKAHTIEDVPPHEMLAGLMKAKDVSQTAVAKATGIPISTISELLSRKREFNVSHIEKLCVYFGVGPSAFIHVKEPIPA